MAKFWRPGKLFVQSVTGSWEYYPEPRAFWAFDHRSSLNIKEITTISKFDQPFSRGDPVFLPLTLKTIGFCIKLRYICGQNFVRIRQSVHELCVIFHPGRHAHTHTDKPSNKLKILAEMQILASNETIWECMRCLYFANFECFNVLDERTGQSVHCTPLLCARGMINMLPNNITQRCTDLSVIRRLINLNIL